MDLRTLGVLLLCTTHLCLGALVVLHNRRALINKLFGLLVVTIVGWILTIFLALSADDPRQILWLARFGFAFASGIPFSLIWMFHAFSTAPFAARDPEFYVPALLCGLSCCLSFSPLGSSTGSARELKAQHFVYGPLHKFFGLLHGRLRLCGFDSVEDHPNVFRSEAPTTQISSLRDRPRWRWRDHYKSNHTAHLENVRVQCAGALLYPPDGLLLCSCDHSPSPYEHSPGRASWQRIPHSSDGGPGGVFAVFLLISRPHGRIIARKSPRH